MECFREQQRRARDVLEAVGIWKFIRNATSREQFLRAHCPEPRLSLSQDMHNVKKRHEILRLARKALKSCTIDLPKLGTGFPATDYFATAKPLADLLLRADFADPIAIREFEQVSSSIKELADPQTVVYALQSIVAAIEEVLILFGRIDQELYWVDLKFGWNEFQQYVMEFIVHCHLAEKRSFEIDGKARPAFRCGQPFHTEIKWIEWEGTVVHKESGKSYSVFIQSHALKNLYQRALFVQDGEWLVHDYLWQSLLNPQVVSAAGNRDKILVEYSLNAHKLGYLVASIVDGSVLIESFLFLTMDGTPEGQKVA
jgi:hypothetical protein